MSIHLSNMLSSIPSNLDDEDKIEIISNDGSLKELYGSYQSKSNQSILSNLFIGLFKD